MELKKAPFRNIGGAEGDRNPQLSYSPINLYYPSCRIPKYQGTRKKAGK